MQGGRATPAFPISALPPYRPSLAMPMQEERRIGPRVQQQLHIIEADLAISTFSPLRPPGIADSEILFLDIDGPGQRAMATHFLTSSMDETVTVCLHHPFAPAEPAYSRAIMPHAHYQIFQGECPTVFIEIPQGLRYPNPGQHARAFIARRCSGIGSSGEIVFPLGRPVYFLNGKLLCKALDFRRSCRQLMRNAVEIGRASCRERV